MSQSETSTAGPLPVANAAQRVNVELFDFTAKLLLLLDLVYFAAIYFTATNPWTALAFAVLLPAFNIPCLKATVRTGRPYVQWSLSITFIPIALMCYFAGPNSPAWVMCFSGLTASLITLSGNRAVQGLVMASLIHGAVWGSYFAGHSVVDLVTIAIVLSAYGTLADRIARFLQGQYAELEISERKAREAAETKEAFLANMSHEIRTPMNGVLGMSKLLLDSGLNPDQRVLAETIQRSGDGLMVVIGDILDFTKLDRGIVELEAIQYPLHTALEDVGSLMAGAASQKGLELIVDIRPGVPRQAVGDPNRLRQIIGNFVSNAIKFTGVGHVRILAEPTPSRDGIRMSVHDTGIGLPSGPLKRLFEPFTQADASTTRRFGGTGLGLPIAKRLALAMGGQIGCKASPDGGAEFWIELPIAADDTPEPQLLDGLWMLIVDPHTRSAEILQDRVERLGAICTTVRTAPEALDLANQVFDAVLVDCLMTWDRQPLSQLISTRFAGDPSIIRMAFPNAAVSGECVDADDSVLRPVRPRQLVSQLLEQTGDEPRKARTAPKSEAPHVLLVEDDLVNQMVARRMLESYGCTVDVASNGREAIERARAHAYPVIFMDCQMPEMDGYEATRAIRKFGGDQPVIVALTAHAMAGDRDRCIATGMDDYLTKPLSDDRLLDVLTRWAHQDRDSAAA